MYDDINSRLGEIVAELEVLATLPDPTDDDVARAQALEDEAARIKTERAEREARAQAIAEVHARNKAEGRTVPGGSLQHLKRVDPFETDVRNMSAGETRDAARAILDRPEARHITDGGKEKADNLISTLDTRMSRWTVASSQPAYRSAFAKYIAGRENLLTNEERQAVLHVEQEARANLALADATGGYAVPVLLDPAVIFTGNGSTNPFRQISRIVTGMDDRWRGVSSSGITAAWVGEATELADASPTLAQPSVIAYKAAAMAVMSVEIEGDWGGLATEVGGLMQQAKDDLEATAFATGSGSSQPFGIVSALVAGSGTVSNVAPTTDGALGVVDVRNLFSTLPPAYRPNASWVMNIDVQNEVRGFDTTGGLSLQTVDLQAGYNFALLGKPVYESSAMDTFTGTTGVANLMVVGDFRNYVIFDRIGARVELVPHLFATANNLPNLQRALVMWWRTGADSVNDNAFRLLRNT